MVWDGRNQKKQERVRRGSLLVKLFQRCFPVNRGRPSQEGERNQLPRLPIETVSLSGKELRVLDIARFGTITCLEGMVWITYPRRFCDYILKPGESLSLRGKGRVVVSGGCRKCTIGISAN